MAGDLFEGFVTEVTTLSNILRKTAARMLREDSLAPAEIRVLQILEEQGSKTVPEIGRQRLTSRQNIQIMVNRLQKAGMVELAPNPSHKRSDLVHLTGKGQSALEHVSEGGSLSRLAVMPEVSDEEIAEATRILQKVRESVARKSVLAKTVRRAVEERLREGGGKSREREVEAEKSGPAAENEELPVSLL